MALPEVSKIIETIEKEKNISIDQLANKDAIRAKIENYVNGKKKMMTLINKRKDQIMKNIERDKSPSTKKRFISHPYKQYQDYDSKNSHYKQRCENLVKRFEKCQITISEELISKVSSEITTLMEKSARTENSLNNEETNIEKRDEDKVNIKIMPENRNKIIKDFKDRRSYVFDEQCDTIKVKIICGRTNLKIRGEGNDGKKRYRIKRKKKINSAKELYVEEIYSRDDKYNNMEVDSSVAIDIDNKPRDVVNENKNSYEVDEGSVKDNKKGKCRCKDKKRKLLKHRKKEGDDKLTPKDHKDELDAAIKELKIVPRKAADYREIFREKIIEKERSYIVVNWWDVFVIDPEDLVIENFVNNQVYKRQINMLNKCGKIMSCRLHSIKLQDKVGSNNIGDIVRTDIKTEFKICPGLPFSFNLTFAPVDFEESFIIEFRFTFFLYNKTYMTLVPVKALFLEEIEVEIKPQIINFGSFAMWRTNKNKMYEKHFTISSSCGKPLEIFIRENEDISGDVNARFKEELNMKAETHRTDVSSTKSILKKEYNKKCMTSYIDMNKIVWQCFDIATNSFRLGKRYLKMRPMKESKVKVYFTDMSYTGCHQMKYLVDIFDSGNFLMSKEICLFAKTYHLPIEISPTLIDLRNASNSSMQVITIANTHKIFSMRVALKLPKLRDDCLYICPVRALIKPKSFQQFELYFLKREDEVENIEEFSVHGLLKIYVKMNCTKYSKAPPVSIPIYAPYTI